MRGTLVLSGSVVMAIVAVLFLHQIQTFRTLEAITYDLRMQLERRIRPIPEAKDIEILGIDDRSLLSFGRWPWPRQYWADIVDSLVELGAKVIFLDVDFPEPITTLLQTRNGRQSLSEVVTIATDMARETILPGTLAFAPSDRKAMQAPPSARPLVPETSPMALETAFSNRVNAALDGLKADVVSLLPQPDQIVSDSLMMARRKGVITAGVITVTEALTDQKARLAHARRQTRKWFVDHPSTAVEALEPSMRTLLTDDRRELELYRKAYDLFLNNPNPDLLSKGLPPELRSYAFEHLYDVRIQVLEDLTEKALAGRDPTCIDTEALYRNSIPEGFQSIGTFSTIVFDQTLSRRLLDRYHLLRLPGIEHIPDLQWGGGLSLPTFTIARALDLVGANTEVRDNDGSFRSVPLFWRTREGVLPTAGLAIYLRLLSREMGGASPELRLEPDRTLVISRPGGRGPLKVPILPGGQCMIHWSGPFDETFSHLPVHILLTFAGLRKEREVFFMREIRQSDYEQTLNYRELVRSLWIKDPDRSFSLPELTVQARSRWPAFAFGEECYLADNDQDPSLSATTRWTPAVWYRFFEAFRERLESDTMARNELMLRMCERTPNPVARTAKRQKYAKTQESYRRLVDEHYALKERLIPQIRDKICIVGHMATSSTDLTAMPFSTQYPKVGSYANLLNTLVQERFIYRPTSLWWPLGGLVHPSSLQCPILVGACILMALVLSASSSQRGAVLGIVLIAGWIVATSALFILRGIWIDMAAPILGMLFTYALVFIHRSARGAEIRHMFESYVDPRIVQVVVENKELWKELGGREHVITAFFSDIANFTTLSELLTAQEVSEMLTDYLSPMTDILLSHDGTRDKYIGDAIVAFFGAPLPTPGHELKACLASIAQQERLAELKAKWRQDRVAWYRKIEAAGKDLTFRIGLNTGPAKIGNFGSLKSKNYTMIGDTVNLASRLEGANKEYGTAVMASATTIAGCRDRLIVRHLDRIQVKGKQEAVTVFEVLGRKTDIRSPLDDLIGEYSAAIELYYGRDFAGAKKGFVRCLARYPADGPSAEYLRRCDRFLGTPPPPEWNGVHVMTHK